MCTKWANRPRGNYTCPLPRSVFPRLNVVKSKKRRKWKCGERRMKEELENQYTRDDVDNSLFTFTLLPSSSTFSWSLPVKTNLENAGIRKKSRVTGSWCIRGDKVGRKSGALINKCRLVYRAFPYLTEKKMKKNWRRRRKRRKKIRHAHAVRAMVFQTLTI